MSDIFAFICFVFKSLLKRVASTNQALPAGLLEQTTVMLYRVDELSGARSTRTPQVASHVGATNRSCWCRIPYSKRCKSNSKASSTGYLLSVFSVSARLRFSRSLLVLAAFGKMDLTFVRLMLLSSLLVCQLGVSFGVSLQE